MELKTTEKFIREAHSAACSTWKSKIESEFPDLFKNEFEVGKWYYNEKYDTVIHLTEFKYDNAFNWYGFNKDKEWFSTEDFGSIYAENFHRLASHKEVEEALIAEAKKRGYKNGVKIKGLGNGEICALLDWNFELIQDEDNTILWFGDMSVYFSGFDIFKDGKWAEILTEEKTVITLDKAKKILAKKYKTTVEQIEIK